VRIDIYAGKDASRVPAYTISEAARYLKLPVGTLRAWTLGQDYGPARRFEPIIKLDDPKRKLMSFAGLAEAHVLAALRRQHRVSLQKIRQALRYIKRSISPRTQHPLAEHRFATVGVSLFVEHLSGLIEVSGEGQMAMRECLDTYLARVTWESGVVASLYPFTRRHVSANDPKVVQIRPEVAFGRPVLAGTRISTAIVAERWMAGESARELAEDYDRPASDIEEAIRWHVQAA
jgi:uncharacterized protein (DUF433 family)